MPGCVGMLVRLIVEVIVARVAQEIIKRLRGRGVWFGWIAALLAFLGIRVRQQIKR